MRRKEESGRKGRGNRGKVEDWSVSGMTEVVVTMEKQLSAAVEKPESGFHMEDKDEMWALNEKNKKIIPLDTNNVTTLK